ncbi:MAG: hypothetical protein FWF35_03090 [Elusimicrobia bacterium]|nr:hypothetical protein [Elusimicrobiota bacterium]
MIPVELYMNLEPILYDYTIKQKKPSRLFKDAIIYSIAQMKPPSNGQILIKQQDIINILDTASEITPQQQLNNLVLYIGESTFMGDSLTVIPSYKDEYKSTYKAAREFSRVIALCGFSNQVGLRTALAHLETKGLIKGDKNRVDWEREAFLTFALTFDGWNLYEELKRGKVDSNIAFMAMQFNNKDLEKFYKAYIQTAVGQTGFRIKRIDEEQRAGLIDAHLRLEISRSRFVISDLTDENNGAYWEAGYAEGLGRPVIYIYDERKHEQEQKDKSKTDGAICSYCNRKIKNAPHFDTNHHLTIFWNPEKPDEFVKKLKETIRFTIPEAKQQD